MVFVPLAFAVLFYLAAFGWRTLDPFYFDWLITGEPSFQFLGWASFQQSEWQFPLGLTSKMMGPIGSSIINTDSIPLVSVLVKALVGKTPLIQFLGPWMLLCYLLQAFFGYRLLLLLTKNKAYSALGSALFLLSPVLLFRAEHKALCAQWLILWGFFLYFKSAKTRALPRVELWVMNVLPAGIHPYLLPMTFGITVATYFNLWRGERTFSRGRGLAIHGLSVLLGIFSLLYVLGYLNLGSAGSWGFNTFTSDLLAFFNSQGTSAFLPRIRYSSSQREGFAYLGLGLILLLLSQAYFWRRDRWLAARLHPVDYGPLLFLCIVAYIVSLSGHISFGGNTVLKISWFYDLFEPLPSIFRSPGRFAWLLHYFLVLGLCLVPYAYFHRRRAFLVLAAVAFIQVIDITPWVFRRSERAPQHTEAASLLSQDFWRDLAGERYQNLMLLPPGIRAENVSCENEAYSKEEVVAFWFKAVQFGMAYNGGIGTRMPKEKAETYCASVWDASTHGSLRNTLFVIPAKGDYWKRFESSMAKQPEKLRCELIGAHHVCRV